jgi:hypothetical protein
MLSKFFQTTQPFLYRLPGLVPLACYVYFLIGGLQFIRDPRRTNALGIGLALQVPVFSSSFFTYMFVSGCSFIVSATTPNNHLSINVNYYLGSSCSFILFGDRDFGIGVNLVALVLLFLLGKSITEAKQAQMAPLHVQAQPARPEPDSQPLPPRETA